MKCEKCGSGMRDEGCSSTCVAYTPFYDDSDNRHVHDGNVISQYYSCKCGHYCIKRSINPCPVIGCEWTRKV